MRADGKAAATSKRYYDCQGEMTKKITWLEGGAAGNHVFPYPTNAKHVKRKRTLELLVCEHAKCMSEILRRKKIALRKADFAVRKALEAAAEHHQLTPLRLRQSPAKDVKELFGDLIVGLKNLTYAISALSPNSKAILNTRIAGITKTNGIFDTELLIECLDCIEASLSELSPMKLLDEALLALRPQNTWKLASPTVKRWMSIPSATLNRIEREVEGKLSELSGLEILRLLPTLLATSATVELQAAEACSRGSLENVGLDLREINAAIAVQSQCVQLTLNGRLAEAAKAGFFDFIEWIDLVEACLPELSRMKLAAFSPEISSRQAQPIANLWEAIPSIIRCQIEREVELKLPKLSGVETLRLLPKLLQRFEPTSRRGAPLSIHLIFLRRIDSIWLDLRLTGRRCYYDYATHDEYAPKGNSNPPSAFQAFCNAALAAVGSESRITNYQISCLKKRAKSGSKSKALNIRNKN
jgi:hypothetical protein